MITIGIISAEIAFWLFILAGLMSRYVFKKERLSIILFVTTPIIDLILLVLTAFDLQQGATATFAHSFAAVYIGVSLAYGKRMIHWADEMFRIYILRTANRKEKKTGLDYAVQQIKSFGLHIFAYVIGSVILWGMIWFIQDAQKTEALYKFWRIWSLVLGIDFAISASYFIWPREKKRALK